jgi:hypothetical protein
MVEPKEIELNGNRLARLHDDRVTIETTSGFIRRITVDCDDLVKILREAYQPR